MNKKIKLSLLFFGIPLLLIVYQLTGSYLDDIRYPPKGEFISVLNKKMHVLSSGKFNGATVILEPGLCGMSEDMGLLHDKIANLTRVVSYDRCGLGYSEASESKRHCRQIAGELKILLDAKGIPGPYILVGHSFGGVVMQYFASTYPDDVKGLVLVDSCPQELFDYELIQSFEPILKNYKQPARMYLAGLFGFSRLICFFSYKNAMSYLPEDMRGVHLACLSSIKHTVTSAREFRDLNKSLRMLKNIDRSLIDKKPCHIISSGKEFNMAYFGLTKLKKEEVSQANIIWRNLQESLASKFHFSVHKISEKSDHMVIWRDPESIVESVEAILSQ